MNLNNVIYPEQYSSAKIYTYPSFDEELKEIIEHSGFKGKFISMYRQRLMYLETNLNQCNIKRDWFEILKGTDGLYAMKIKGSKNIRIIFKFVGYNNQNIALLLCTFEETGSKTNTKGGYNDAIVIAEKRLNELKSFLD